MAHRGWLASPELRDDAADCSENTDPDEGIEQDNDVEEDLEHEDASAVDEERTIGEEFLEDVGDWDDDESTDIEDDSESDLS